MIDYKKQIKVIGLDMDQTLYPKSSEIDEAIQIYIYQKIAQHKNCNLNEAEKLFKDLYKEGRGLSGGKTLIRLGIPNAREVIQEALENADIAKFLQPNSEVLQLLQDLKKKYHNIDLITSSNKKNMTTKLRKMSIPVNIFFHIITGSDSVSKSDGKAYELWLSFYENFKPEQFLYIGDKVSSDYVVPKKMGIQTILVNIKDRDDAIECPQFSSLIEIKSLLFSSKN